MTLARRMTSAAEPRGAGRYSLRGVQTRRYLLRRSAREILLLGIGGRISSTCARRSSAAGSTARLPLRPATLRGRLEIGNSSPEALFRKSDITARWCRREMSNFDYIMGAQHPRAVGTYNDITQYPARPGIADYESETLNLDAVKDATRDPETGWRAHRIQLERIKERYDAFDDPEIPKFHYGSHYSARGHRAVLPLEARAGTSLAAAAAGGQVCEARRPTLRMTFQPAGKASRPTCPT